MKVHKKLKFFSKNTIYFEPSAYNCSVYFKTRTVLFFKQELFGMPADLAAHKVCILIGSKLYCM